MVSSTYKPICLSHTPPLVIDEELSQRPDPLALKKPTGHGGCDIAIGRFSYPIIEVWLPDREEAIDVAWIRKYPALAKAIIEETL
jgi:hypothetical protein